MRHPKIIPLIIARLLLHLSHSTESLAIEDGKELFLTKLKLKLHVQFKVDCT